MPPYMRMILYWVISILLFSLTGSIALAQALLPDDGRTDTAHNVANATYRKSDSPWLQLPPDKQNIPPQLPPSPKEVSAAGGVADPTAVEEYIVATGEIRRFASTDLSQVSAASTALVIPSYPGLLPSIEGKESIIGTDGRTRVADTTGFPWRTIVRLIVTFPNGSSGGCSGAFVGNFHVLTAGHCVHDQSAGGWASTIEVIPGLDDTYMPYARAWSVSMRSYTGWTVDADSRHDWGLLTLDRNVGSFTGWMGQRYEPPSNGIYTGILNNAGYPGDLCSGNCLYFDSDNGHSADEFNHWYSMDTMGGQSGSPVWWYNAASPVACDRCIVSIHTCGTGGCGVAGKSVNHGTRLNQDKFNRLNTWIAADSAPTDRADLIDDGQAFSGFTPTSVTRGVTNFQISNDVRNIGTAASGNYQISYYASTNNTISTADYLIGTVTLSSLSPFTWHKAQWQGVFPGNIPAGTYWVGWIIDSGNAVNEFDETNNVEYKAAYQLTVANPIPPAATTLIGPLGSINTGTPSFQWNRVNAATWYYLWIDNGAGNVHKQWYLASNVCSGTTCSVTPSGLTLAPDVHYWWVLTWNEGGSGPWSSPLSFIVSVGSPPAAPALIAPSGVINTSTPSFQWNRVNTATWYYLWVDNGAGNVFKQWYHASNICSGTTCSITPSGLTLTADIHYWWVLPWNGKGSGPWSNPLGFIVSVGSPPAATTLIAPSGSINTRLPLFQWNRVNAATWYYLWIDNDAGSNVFKQWYPAGSICAATTCGITPSGLTLGTGRYRWWVLTWNGKGSGPWSNPLDFTVLAALGLQNEDGAVPSTEAEANQGRLQVYLPVIASGLQSDAAQIQTFHSLPTGITEIDGELQPDLSAANLQPGDETTPETVAVFSEPATRGEPPVDLIYLPHIEN